ncbi:hypothetical protein HLB23_02275 [Nocardia uniformis]|uniref:Uncharacterized protein n=1 Tax=Nocardia uniformis TaxID=53432 RepID=A0A849BUZ3_9NOCA|nr:hypothetical protein [Nocardia uniformis]NNH68716.1 hypothetical protein [Nocardia uniformis]
MTGFEPHTLETNGLRIQLTTRRLAGPLVPGRPPQRWFWFAMRIPALVLIGVVLIAPTAWTLGRAAAAQPRMVVGCTLAAVSVVVGTLLVRHRASTTGPWGTRYRRWTPVSTTAALLIALSLIGVELGWDGAWAYLRTVGWIAFGEALVGVALGIAWWGKNSRWLWGPLIIPFGISAFVSGIAFRLIFEWLADRFALDSVLQYRIWFGVMLLSAFLWTWLGVLICLCRAAILGLDADPVRSAGLYSGEDREPNFSFATLRTLVRLLRPPLLLFGLVVGIAAARVFDVVLIAVPGTMQVAVDSATVHWWNLAATSGFDSGEASAYALPLAVLIGLVAWALQPDMRRYRRHWVEERPSRMASGRNRIGPRMLLAMVTLLTVVPIAVLAFGAVRQGSGFGWDAWRWASGDDALWRSLETTAWVAVLATVVVAGAAVPIAYRLAALATDGLKTGVVVPILVVLTVMPAQLYAGPIRTLMDSAGLSGTRIPLILVHASAGLPMAILILRGALLAPPDSPAADALHGLTSPETALRRFGTVAGPALGAVVVLEFIQVWNDFFIGLLVSGAGGSPWSLLLWGEARQFHENAAHLAVGALISAVVPVLLLLATWRRWLVPGLTGGFPR